MIRHILITPLNAILLLALAGFTSAAFLLVPAGTVVPVHWGPTGVADGFAERTTAYLMAPGFALLLLILAGLILRFSRPEAVEAGQHAVGTAISALLGLFAVIQGAMLEIGLGQAVDMARVIAAGFAVMLIALGNVMPKTQPNRAVGIRLPWLLRDAALWQHTHRFVGAMHVVAGVLLLVMAAVPLPALAYFAGILAAVLLPLLIGGVVSYRRAHRPA